MKFVEVGAAVATDGTSMMAKAKSRRRANNTFEALIFRQSDATQLQKGFILDCAFSKCAIDGNSLPRKKRGTIDYGKKVDYVLRSDGARRACAREDGDVFQLFKEV